ncbi:TetR family transcriptional regulator [Tamilnaduibacter salinus]|uniref:TetR family transcriptional regulator n=1 Tax=Tamilnaduibacter salinus TaxID=1484056 RepID=A0A2U1CTR9_9GAMM|nr:TetR/AcrR family transcriptional regulator [Tamilnaduibacter salinus]PVY70112.1 TetR family transcriptional regulator [Tamilnaduibacter salinus]
MAPHFSSVSVGMAATSSKSRARSRAKKREILRKALECFAVHGLEHTTIDMIRAETGVSVGSLYHHFGNKDAIASAVFIEGMRDFSQRALEYLDQVASSSGGATEKAERLIKALVYANVDWISANPNWAQFVFHHRRTVGKAGGASTLNRDVESFYGKLAAILGPYVEGGHIRNLPAPLYGSFISGPAHDYARHWLAGRYAVPIQDVREELAEGAWRALNVNDGVM